MSEIKEPLYLVTVKHEGQILQQKYVPIREAGIMWDSNWFVVEIADLVLMPDLTVRPIKPEENTEIQEIADEYSASK